MHHADSEIVVEGDFSQLVCALCLKSAVRHIFPINSALNSGGWRRGFAYAFHAFTHNRLNRLVHNIS